MAGAFFAAGGGTAGAFFAAGGGTAGAFFAAGGGMAGVFFAAGGAATLFSFFAREEVVFSFALSFPPGA
jgi:hypothetical protein